MDPEQTIHFDPALPASNVGDDVPTLRALSGPLEGREYRLSSPEYVIGRDPISDIVIEAKDVSRRHAKIEKTLTEYVVCDLGSSNGVYVNNLKLPRSVLMNGDLVQIGSCVFQFIRHRALDNSSSHAA
jgi:pSer/pThr/pTyr-binding forkhead associated (FHA) protein